ncbi:MAG TPA: SRPBCC family protein [Actinocrinis sp.]|nr:SRPBCC family protein [Actinocrinis sp.]
MAQVRAVTSRQVGASAQAVFEALADYATVRPKILPAQYSDYVVREGGVGAGTVVSWQLAATQRRTRSVLARVSQPVALTLVEADENSSMRVTWTVSGQGDVALVTVEAVWNGAQGVGGFFERTFAPKGLNRIHDQVLAGLASYVEA